MQPRREGLENLETNGLHVVHARKHLSTLHLRNPLDQQERAPVHRFSCLQFVDSMEELMSCNMSDINRNVNKRRCAA